jgi:hypothetical protein
LSALQVIIVEPWFSSLPCNFITHCRCCFQWCQRKRLLLLQIWSTSVSLSTPQQKLAYVAVDVKIVAISAVVKILSAKEKTAVNITMSPIFTSIGLTKKSTSTVSVGKADDMTEPMILLAFASRLSEYLR